MSISLLEVARSLADEMWPHCCEGFDPVSAFGPEYDPTTHPADRYWFVMADGEAAGLGWASRWENNHTWSQGLALLPEHRRSGLAPTAANLIRREVFRDPEAHSTIFMAYSTNPRVVASHDKGPAWKHKVGVVADAGGQGIDIHIWQVRRQEWLDAHP